jgi:hypothetical protein
VLECRICSLSTLNISPKSARRRVSVLAVGIAPGGLNVDPLNLWKVHELSRALLPQI